MKLPNDCLSPLSFLSHSPHPTLIPLTSLTPCTSLTSSHTHSRVYRYLKQSILKRRVAVGAPIYLSAVLEYLCAEVLELAGNAARDNKKKLITPRHILLAVGNDDELHRVCPSVFYQLFLTCLSVCQSACLSVCLSVCLSACLSVCLSTCLSVCLSACLSVYQFVPLNCRVEGVLRCSVYMCVCV